MVPRILWMLALCLSVGGESLSQEKLKEMEYTLNVLFDIVDNFKSNSPPEYNVLEGLKFNPSSKENKTMEYTKGKPTATTPYSTTKGKPTATTPYSTTKGKPTATTPYSTEPTEDHHVGSIPGIPGVHYPNYRDIPITSFTCSDKNDIPGLYADMEAGCQVFHICWPHRRESFLCPIGTTFNQAILTCDYWYSTNCSLALHYYNANEIFTQARLDDKSVTVISMMEELLEKKREFETVSNKSPREHKSDSDFKKILNFLPVKAKISVYPETADKLPKIVAEASIGKLKKSYKHPVTKAPKVTQKYTPELVTPALKLTEFLKVKADETSVGSKVLSKIESVLDKIQFILSNEYIPFVIKKLKAIDESKKDKGTTHRKPLTKLNPKFITKPVFSKPQQSYAGKLTVLDSLRIVPESRDAKISLSTKKMLIENYLKLLMKGPM